MKSEKYTRTQNQLSVLALLNRLHLDRNILEIISSWKDYANENISKANQWIPEILRYLIGLWISVLAYFYITIPCHIMSVFFGIIRSVTRYCILRSLTARKAVVHFTSLWEIMENIMRRLLAVKISVLIVEGLQALGDMFSLWLEDYRRAHGVFASEDSSSLSLEELNQLVFYEEISDSEQRKLNGGPDSCSNLEGERTVQSMKRSMHHYVPSQTFRATVRGVRPTSASEGHVQAPGLLRDRANSSTSSPMPPQRARVGFQALPSAFADLSATLSPLLSPLLLPSAARARISSYSMRPSGLSRSSSGGSDASPVSVHPRRSQSGRATSGGQTCASPASLPRTPFSRAQVMSKQTERVITTLFMARDVLRLEMQALAPDALSREVAEHRLRDKKLAAFDPKQAAEGLVLTCGNHCVLKAGPELCGTVRATLPVLQSGAFVYFEFSVTATADQRPVLGLGLSTAEGSLTALAGAAPTAVGLHSEGRLLVGSRWFGDLEPLEITGGCTVGFLVRMPSCVLNEALPQSGADVAPRDDMTESKLEPTCPPMSPPLSGVSDTSSLFVRININGRLIPQSAAAQAAVADVGAALTRQTTSVAQSWTGTEPGARNAMSGLATVGALYPTVSLLSQGTRVWCRFAYDDVLMKSHEAIGAIAGAPVYCLDGSLLLGEHSVA